MEPIPGLRSRRKKQERKEAVKIAMNGGYYGTTTSAALYRDGTVAAYINIQPVDAADAWMNITEIACCDGAVFALDAHNRLFCADRTSARVVAGDIRGIACGLCDAVAIDLFGRLHRFDREGEEKWEELS